MKLGTDARAAISELKKYGAEIVSTEISGSGHVKIYYRKNEKVRFIIAASTGSDSYRGPDQARSHVRRALGVVNAVKAPQEERKRKTKKTKTSRKTEAFDFTPGKDYFGTLKHSPLYAASLIYAIDQAFSAYFGFYLRAAGHKIKCEKIRKALDDAERRS
jgi:hypothetical protein